MKEPLGRREPGLPQGRDFHTCPSQNHCHLTSGPGETKY
jgi:hypothetical protein